MKSLWCAFLILLVACHGVNADDEDPNDPNGLSRAEADAVVEDPNDPNGLSRVEADVVVEDPNDPNELMRVKWDAIISILQNKDIDQEAKKKQINKLVTPVFDFPLIAKLALGRTHWPKLTPPQCEKFTRLFTELVKESYLAKIELYKDETVLFKPGVQKKKSLYIPTELVHKERKVAILYKLRKVDERWKIYDMEIQGVSVVLSYRSQFDEILRRGTVEDLLSRLEKPPDD